MIMSMVLNFMMIFMMIVSTNFFNPVKLSMMLMLISGLMFFKIYLITSMVWYPFLFFLIFMGGILMMFMILSSVLPNEKNYKNKSLMFVLPALMAVVLMYDKFNSLSIMTKSVKSSLDSSNTFTSLMMLMLMYFFITILMVSKEETPMRKSLC